MLIVWLHYIWCSFCDYIRRSFSWLHSALVLLKWSFVCISHEMRLHTYIPLKSAIGECILDYCCCSSASALSTSPLCVPGFAPMKTFAILPFGSIIKVLRADNLVPL
jgi:hypothetical protein